MTLIHGTFYPCSVTDWKFAAEQFVRILPDKVIVHRKEIPFSFLFLYAQFLQSMLCFHSFQNSNCCSLSTLFFLSCITF